MTASFVFVVSYVYDGFACSEMFDTEQNAKRYVANLEAGRVSALYEMGSAWVDCKAIRGSNWVEITAV